MSDKAFEEWWESTLFADYLKEEPKEDSLLMVKIAASRAWEAAPASQSQDWIPVDFTKPRDEWPECLRQSGWFGIFEGKNQDIENPPAIAFWDYDDLLYAGGDGFVDRRLVYCRTFITHIKPITLSEPPREDV